MSSLAAASTTISNETLYRQTNTHTHTHSSQLTANRLNGKAREIYIICMHVCDVYMQRIDYDGVVIVDILLLLIFLCALPLPFIFRCFRYSFLWSHLVLLLFHIFRTFSKRPLFCCARHFIKIRRKNNDFLLFFNIRAIFSSTLF